jgi:hypothetical protein
MGLDPGLIRRLGPDGRLPSGMTVRAAVRGAAFWWDKTGRHLARNPEFKDPDRGFPSGILRGLPWDNLSRVEQVKIFCAWHDNFAQALTDNAGGNAPAARILEFAGRAAPPKPGKIALPARAGLAGGACRGDK